MVLQKELLYALFGYTGQVVVESADGSAFELARGLPLVDGSERALINRLLVIGRCYRDLEQFVGLHVFGEPEPDSYANAGGGTPLAEDRDAAADGGYRQFMPTPHATPTSRRVT